MGHQGRHCRLVNQRVEFHTACGTVWVLATIVFCAVFPPAFSTTFAIAGCTHLQRLRQCSPFRGRQMRAVRVGRSNGFVCLLSKGLFGFRCSGGGFGGFGGFGRFGRPGFRMRRYIRIPKPIQQIRCRLLHKRCRQPLAIRTHICNVPTFIEFLGKPHCGFGCPFEPLVTLLLERGGSERGRGGLFGLRCGVIGDDPLPEGLEFVEDGVFVGGR